MLPSALQAQVTAAPHDATMLIEKYLRYKKCGRCKQRLRYTFKYTTETHQFEYKLVCDCKGSMPVPINQNKSAEREWDMTTNQMAVREVQGLSRLTPQAIAEAKRFLKTEAPENDVGLFLLYCAANHMDPFSGDAYLVHYKSRDGGPGKSSIIKSVNLKVRRAANHPTFQSYQNGVVLLVNGQLVEREGTIRLDGEQLVGGWCTWWTKGAQHPIKHTIMRSKYDRQALGQRGTPWDDKPEEMCAKVALSQVASRFAGIDDGPAVIESEGHRLDVVAEDAPIVNALPVQAAAPAQPAAPITMPAAPVEYTCEKHNTKLFPSQYRKGQYYHFVEGAKGPKGGKVSCPGVKADGSPMTFDGPPAPAPAQAQAPAATGEAPKFKNLNEALAAIFNEIGWSKAAALEAAGVKDVAEIADPNDFYIAVMEAFAKEHDMVKESEGEQKAKSTQGVK